MICSVIFGLHIQKLIIYYELDFDVVFDSGAKFSVLHLIDSFTKEKFVTVNG